MERRVDCFTAQAMLGRGWVVWDHEIVKIFHGRKVSETYLMINVFALNDECDTLVP